jgi:hypothetical protein
MGGHKESFGNVLAIFTKEGIHVTTCATEPSG